MYNPPLIGTDGTIYITEYEYASITDHIRAYNPDGSLKWVFNPEDISSEYKGADFESCPVIGSDGTFYIAAGYPGGMYAINPDGTLKWNKPGKGNLTIGPNDTIYCGGSTGVYAFDSNGDQKWFYETAVAEQATAVGLDGTVYAGKTNSGQGDGRLIAIDSNGSFKWEYTVGVTPLTPPIVGSDGTIYIGTYWYLYAVSPDGTLKWKYDTGGHDYKFASPAIGPDGTIYIGINGGLVAIDPTGTLKWEYDLPSLSSTFRPNTLSIDKEGIIYVGTRDSLIAINSDGTLKWEYEDSYSHFIYPVIGGEGRLYVGMKLSFLWAFDSSLLEDAIEQLPENVEVASKYYDIIPQSQSKVYSFNLDSKKNLGAVVNWSGNELLLRVFRPDETLYGEYEISSPPFTFTIPGAESGIWQFEISSTDILNGDYPFALVTGTFTPIPGDVDRDGNVNLTDAILAIRICAGITPSVSICPEADVNGDGKIGLAEVVYILQKVSGLRQ